MTWDLDLLKELGRDQNIYMGAVQSPFMFSGLSQDLREAFASFRAWGFTTVDENGFSLGLETFTMLLL